MSNLDVGRRDKTEEKMKFYHGSPKKLKILIPHKAKGLTGFQNKKAIFITRSFKQAALYAISKSLKGKTKFALPPRKIIIVGNFKLSKGYVYEMELDKDKLKKGDFGDYEFAYFKPIKEFKIHIISPAKYTNKVIYVKDKRELMENLK